MKNYIFKRKAANMLDTLLWFVFIFETFGVVEAF